VAPTNVNLERELAFVERSLLSFLDGPFAFDEPRAYASRAFELIGEAQRAASVNVRTNRYADAAVAAALGALATAFAERQATRATSELAFLIHSLKRTPVATVDSRLAELAAALDSRSADLEAAFVAVAVAAAAAASAA